MIRKLLQLLRIPRPCKDISGHDFEFGWDMQPQLCRRCHLRHDDLYDWSAK